MAGSNKYVDSGGKGSLEKLKDFLKVSGSSFNESLLLETGDDEGKRNAIHKLIDKTVGELKDFDVADTNTPLLMSAKLRTLEKQIQLILSQEKRS